MLCRLNLNENQAKIEWATRIFYQSANNIMGGHLLSENLGYLKVEREACFTRPAIKELDEKIALSSGINKGNASNQSIFAASVKTSKTQFDIFAWDLLTASNKVLDIG